jgi:hypothetical protein
MLKTALAVTALAAALSLGATVDRAAAMPSATPTQLGLATADNGLVQKTALVCGRWGCRRVWGGAGVWPGRPLYGFAGPVWSGGWVRPGWGWGRPGWGWGRPAWGWNRPWWGWNTW